MKLHTFKIDKIYLPVTMQQYEDLTNEILAAVNKVMAPHFCEADYLSQVLMSGIHALKHERGIVTKSELFETCINRISCHVTYHVVEEIQKKIKAKQIADGIPAAPPAASDDGSDPMVPAHPVSLVPDAKESG